MSVSRWCWSRQRSPSQGLPACGPDPPSSIIMWVYHGVSPVDNHIYHSVYKICVWANSTCSLRAVEGLLHCVLRICTDVNELIKDSLVFDCVWIWVSLNKRRARTCKCLLMNHLWCCQSVSVGRLFPSNNYNDLSCGNHNTGIFLELICSVAVKEGVTLSVILSHHGVTIQLHYITNHNKTIAK